MNTNLADNSTKVVTQFCDKFVMFCFERSIN